MSLSANGDLGDVIVEVGGKKTPGIGSINGGFGAPGIPGEIFTGSTSTSTNIIDTNNANKLVSDGFTRSQGYANTAFTSATAFTTTLGALLGQLKDIVDFSKIDIKVDPFINKVVPFIVPTDDPKELDDKEFKPPLSVDENKLVLRDVSPLNVADTKPTFTTNVPTINIPAIKEPTPIESTLSPGAAPTFSDVQIPVAPFINASVSAATIPDVPTLLSIAIPTVPAIDSFVRPTLSVGLPRSPANTFSFAERSYTSDLLTALRSKLTEWVNGISTGLDPAVEQAIWNRGRARDIVSGMRKQQEAIRAFASRGFTKPTGALGLQIQEAIQEVQDTSSTLSRDVMIKQADLEQTNRRFAFEQSWKVEEGLITYTNQVAQRAFDTAKYVQQVAIDIFQQEITRFNAQVQAYVAQVEGYKADLQSNITKLEIYKAELEGQRILGEINIQRLEAYRVKIEGVKSIIELFRARVEGANLQIAANKNILDQYATRVSAYSEMVKSKATEYDQYATRIKAEVSKLDGYKAEGEIFNQKIVAYKTFLDYEIAKKDTEIKLNQTVPLDKFKTLIDIYRAKIDSESTRVKTLNEQYGNKIRVFDARNQAELARVSAESAVYNSEVGYKTNIGQLTLEALKADVQRRMQQLGYLIESLKTGAQVQAQLAASALAGVGLHAGITSAVSTGTSFSSSESFNESVGISAGANYNYTIPAALPNVAQ